MVVEDDRNLQTVTTRILTESFPGVTVDWATSFNEAEQKLKEVENRFEDIDLIIADINLPGDKNGVELWKSFQFKFRHTSFLLMSGLPLDEVFRLTQDLKPAPMVLPKPFTVREYLAAIHASIDRNKWGRTVFS